MPVCVHFFVPVRAFGRNYSSENKVSNVTFMNRTDFRLMNDAILSLLSPFDLINCVREHTSAVPDVGRMAR